jgi:hypothetical protein
MDFLLEVHPYLIFKKAAFFIYKMVIKLLFLIRELGPLKLFLISAGMPCFITGWGVNKMSKTEILLPKKLQVLKTLIVSKVNCAQVAGHPIPAFMICTGLNVLNKAPCNVSTLTSDEY